MLKQEAVWFITGCSKGFGRAIAEQALSSGYRVVATARKREDVDDIEVKYPDMALAVELDVTKQDKIKAAVAEAEKHFGSVDVLVNNAGYGYMSAIEEGEDAEVRSLFETNVFAPVNLIKAVLPGMRAHGKGYIINFSSAGGFVTYSGVGYYSMAKFAIEALSETLAKEVNGLGIRVMVVEPGPFRTGFRGSASMRESKTKIDAYNETVGKARERTAAGDGKQSGDPVRGARAIIKAVEADAPPLHLVLGGEVLDQFRQKIAELQRDWEAWEETTRATDFPK